MFVLLAFCEAKYAFFVRKKQKKHKNLGLRSNYAIIVVEKWQF